MLVKATAKIGLPFSRALEKIRGAWPSLANP